MDENELVAAARLGDQDAFAELYRRHIGYVRAIGRSILRNGELEDMCQDTFLLAFTRLADFEGQAQFRTWITRIAINQCLVRLRKSRQASNGESNLLRLDDIVDRYVLTNRDMQLEGVGARLDLDKVMQGLDPKQRRMLEMAYRDGMPEVQIAEVMGIPVAAVTNRIYRLKRKIRNLHKKP